MLLKVNNIHYKYPNNIYKSLDSIDVTIQKGEIVALVGESGSGKSTLLKAIYGIIDVEGSIMFENDLILGPKYQLIPGHDEIKYLAQNLELVNYASVYDNVGTFISNVDGASKEQRINEILFSVGLDKFAQEIPRNLSGGQRQRVALARAIAKTPKLLLLDEPFANIDNILKLTLRDQLFELFKKLEITILFTTHDMHDALGFADRIIIIQEGKKIQEGNPQEVYENPESKYVAALFEYVNEVTDEELTQWFTPESSIIKRKFYFPNQLNISDLQVDYTLVRKIFLGNRVVHKISINSKILYLEA